jgi:alpha-ribazole phosphatase
VNGFALHLMRHGPPLRPGLLLGHTDEPALDPACPKLLGRAGGLAVEGIVTSDLSRARISAELAATARGLPLSIDPRWRELGFGDWEGLAPALVPQDLLGRFWADPDGDPPPGGERWSGLRNRVAKGLAAISRPTLVFTHAGAMRAALSVLTGLDHRGVWALDLPYGALLTLRVWQGEPLSGQIVGLQTDDVG